MPENNFIKIKPKEIAVDNSKKSIFNSINFDSKKI